MEEEEVAGGGWRRVEEEEEVGGVGGGELDAVVRIHFIQSTVFSTQKILFDHPCMRARGVLRGMYISHTS